MGRCQGLTLCTYTTNPSLPAGFSRLSSMPSDASSLRQREANDEQQRSVLFAKPLGETGLLNPLEKQEQADLLIRSKVKRERSATNKPKEWTKGLGNEA